MPVARKAPPGPLEGFFSCLDSRSDPPGRRPEAAGGQLAAGSLGECGAVPARSRYRPGSLKSLAGGVPLALPHRRVPFWAGAGRGPRREHISRGLTPRLDVRSWESVVKTAPARDEFHQGVLGAFQLGSCDAPRLVAQDP